MSDEGFVRQKTQVASPAELAAAREARGMSQLDISQRIKLQVKQVNALEEGQWDALPGKSFVRGALRSYGKLLDVDVSPLLESIGGFGEPAQVQGMQPLDTPISRSSGLGFNGGGRGSPILWVIAGLIGVVALVLYFGSDQDSSRIRSWLPSGESPAGAAPEPTPPAAPSGGSPSPAGGDGASSAAPASSGGAVSAVPAGSSPQPVLSSLQELPQMAAAGTPTAAGASTGSSGPAALAPVAPESGYAAPSSPGMSVPAADASAPASASPAGTPLPATAALLPSAVDNPTSASAGTGRPASGPAVASNGTGGAAPGSADSGGAAATLATGSPAATAAAVPGAGADGPASAAAAAMETKGVMQVKAEQDSWVEVRQADGSALHNGLVRAGASIELKGSPPYRVVLGNASHVELSYEGRVQDLAPHIRANNIARLQLR